MRYAFVAATLFSGAVLAHISPVNQIADGQVQVQNSAPAASVTAAPEVQETKTAYSTQEVTITSCGPEVVSCPARVYTTSYPVVSSAAPPASPEETSVPVAVPVESSPAPAPVPVESAPVVPASPEETKPASPVVASETCPPPTEVTVTVTVSGTPEATPAVPASPESASPESPAAAPSSPASPASPETPASSVPASPEVPASPASPAVPESPAGTAPAAGTGTASPSGTGAPSSPISPPITPYTGSGAATIGASFGVAGLAAIAAIFLA